MIGRLKGLVDQPAEGSVLIDVGGVGYVVFCSARTLGRLPRAGEPASLLIETHVREDHIHLYGFFDAAERDWFRLLTTVQGVGSKVALSVLGTLPPERLQTAILAQDRTALSAAEGVGPKLAARIVNELKDKVGGFAPAPSGAAVDRAGASVPAPSGLGDAVSALVNLGYKRIDAFGAVTKASRDLGEGAPVEALIRGGLKELAS